MCLYRLNKIFSISMLSLLAITAIAAETTRVSISSIGKQGNYDSQAGISISANGRYVAFGSDASNLVAGDTNGYSDIFVYDRQTKQTSRVSLSSEGVQGNSASGYPVISADGRFVGFTSDSNNLVAGDTNSVVDAFVHDRQTKQTTRISVNGAVQGNHSSFVSGISADGRFVAFDSDATNLVFNDTNFDYDVFVHDRLTKQTSRVSIATGGTQGSRGRSFLSSISADGRFIAFGSEADNLVGGDTNNSPDIFVHDRQTKQTSRVSIASNGEQGNSGSNYPVISADGRYVVFSSGANNLVTGDSNDRSDIFVHDRLTKKTTRVNVASNGNQANTDSYDRPNISADGRFVAFASPANNLVDGDNNDLFDIFVHDRQTKLTTRINIGLNGEQEGFFQSYNSMLSADGRFVAFISDVSNLVLGDTNNAYDVFVHDQKLDVALSADLKITVVQKPVALAVNSTGVYQFKVANLGPDSVNDVRLTHVLSNGSQVSGFLPSQGSCNSYTKISLCRLGTLLPGKSLNLYLLAKAIRDPLIQRLTVADAPKDTVSSNNYLNVSTPVTP